MDCITVLTRQHFWITLACLTGFNLDCFDPSLPVPLSGCALMVLTQLSQFQIMDLICFGIFSDHSVLILVLF